MDRRQALTVAGTTEGTDEDVDTPEQIRYLLVKGEVDVLGGHDEVLLPRAIGHIAQKMHEVLKNAVNLPRFHAGVYRLEQARPLKLFLFAIEEEPEEQPHSMEVSALSLDEPLIKVAVEEMLTEMIRKRVQLEGQSDPLGALWREVERLRSYVWRIPLVLSERASMSAVHAASPLV
jgi:hypothetical protein